MRILSRYVVVSKPVEDIKRILLSSAFVFSNPKFVSNTFSIHIGRRYTCRGLFLIPIKGNVSEVEGNTRVVLEVHAEETIAFSGILILAGILGLLWSYANSIDSRFPALVMILTGIWIALQFIWEGKDTLKQLENKLQR